MRIAETELIPVVVPTRPDAVNSAEWGQDCWGDMEHILIRVRTDEGIVAFLTLRLDPGSTLAEAHQRASEVEERLRRARPDVADVIVHTEP